MVRVPLPGFGDECFLLSTDRMMLARALTVQKFGLGPLLTSKIHVMLSKSKFITTEPSREDKIAIM